MQDNYHEATFVEDFLNNYLSIHHELVEFPNDEQLDVMYNELGNQYQGESDVDTQQFGSLLWLFLIGSLYRRYPYYRRRRGRRFRRRRAYGYSTEDLMLQLKGKMN